MRRPNTTRQRIETRYIRGRDKGQNNWRMSRENFLGDTKIKKEHERWERSSMDELYRNLRTISEEIGLNRVRLAGHDGLR